MMFKEYFNICNHISIDTEGSEYEILKSFDLNKYRENFLLLSTIS